MVVAALLRSNDATSTTLLPRSLTTTGAGERSHLLSLSQVPGAKRFHLQQGADGLLNHALAEGRLQAVA